MRTSPRGISLICRFEGFSPVVYKDIAGYPTIGYGHLIRKGESFTSISENEARTLLAGDLRLAEGAVSRLITRSLSQNEFDALASFTFNLGSGALQRSTLRQKCNRGEDCASEFLKWHWAGGVRSRGLLKRRKAEAELYAE